MGEKRKRVLSRSTQVWDSDEGGQRKVYIFQPSQDAPLPTSSPRQCRVAKRKKKEPPQSLGQTAAMPIIPHEGYLPQVIDPQLVESLDLPPFMRKYMDSRGTAYPLPTSRPDDDSHHVPHPQTIRTSGVSVDTVRQHLAMIHREITTPTFQPPWSSPPEMPSFFSDVTNMLQRKAQHNQTRHLPGTETPQSTASTFPTRDDSGSPDPPELHVQDAPLPSEDGLGSIQEPEHQNEDTLSEPPDISDFLPSRPEPSQEVPDTGSTLEEHPNAETHSTPSQGFSEVLSPLVSGEDPDTPSLTIVTDGLAPTSTSREFDLDPPLTSPATLPAPDHPTLQHEQSTGASESPRGTSHPTSLPEDQTPHPSSSQIVHPNSTPTGNLPAWTRTLSAQTIRQHLSMLHLEITTPSQDSWQWSSPWSSTSQVPSFSDSVTKVLQQQQRFRHAFGDTKLDSSSDSTIPGQMVLDYWASRCGSQLFAPRSDTLPTLERGE